MVHIGVRKGRGYTVGHDDDRSFGSKGRVKPASQDISFISFELDISAVG
jgi:hypothetical protein